MYQNIIGRTKELAILEKIMQADQAEFLAVYGRRRVGKTFLIYEFFKPHLVFSFSGSFEQPLAVQLGHFFKEYLRATNGRMESIPPKDWNTAFSYLTDFLKQEWIGKKEKAVVFIDEMPWLDSPRSGFIAALEYFWNQHASKMPQVVLVACVSKASWIKQKLLKSKGGLYNRVTKRIELKPFNLQETAAYCAHKRLKFSNYQIARLYMVMGGIPFYLNELSTGKSVDQLIDEICFSTNGLLSEEFEQIYHSLFKSAEHHMALVETLAKYPYGLTRKRLVQLSGLGDGGVFVRALDDLTESGFLIKHQPFQKKAKDSIYRLIDMYSLFYIRFIRGNVSGLENTFQQIVTDSSYQAWCGYAFENICMLHIPQIIKAMGLSGTFTQVSSWYHKGNDEIPGAQIDLLIDRKDGMINCCEAKFTSNEFVITKDYAATLRRKRSVFQQVTGTKKNVVTTLISTWPALRNSYYQDEVYSEVTLDDLFG
ncbi:MAG TPA: ATP-binding protein [Saprospiraceae bacterium]|nr:ATP-binding protein [Saprospiraceae bacterium]HMQ83144.1 ATP-binding protein [Saprospiraceae bacterium]